MFQFPWCPSLSGYLSITSGGLPHSEISGSTPACGSPKLIAAFYVLHRLLAPRHPPYALCNLTYCAIASNCFLVDCLAAINRLLRISRCSHKRTFRFIYILLCAVFKVHLFKQELHYNMALTLCQHLSCRKNVVETSGIEPLTPCLQGRCSPS